MDRDPEKLKAWRRRSKQLKRGKSQLKRTRIKPVNSKRKAKLRAEQFGEDGKREWIIGLPCIVCGRSPSEPAHAKSRGAGGTSEHLLPMCHRHHREQHMMGVTSFGVVHGVDLMAEAEHYHKAWILRRGAA